jgi:hypothetical protein
MLGLDLGGAGGLGALRRRGRSSPGDSSQTRPLSAPLQSAAADSTSGELFPDNEAAGLHLRASGLKRRRCAQVLPNDVAATPHLQRECACIGQRSSRPLGWSVTPPQHLQVCASGAVFVCLEGRQQGWQGRWPGAWTAGQEAGPGGAMGPGAAASRRLGAGAPGP